MKRKVVLLALSAILTIAPACLHAQNAPTAICENNSNQCSVGFDSPSTIGTIFANTWVSLYGTNMPIATQVVFSYYTSPSNFTQHTLAPIFASSTQVNVCATMPGVINGNVNAADGVAFAELEAPTGGGGSQFLQPPVEFVPSNLNPGYQACS